MFHLDEDTVSKLPALAEAALEAATAAGDAVDAAATFHGAWPDLPDAELNFLVNLVRRLNAFAKRHLSWYVT